MSFVLTLTRPEVETKSLIEEMEKGVKLVCKCSKIRLWNYVYYSDKLNKLDETILRFFQVDLQVQNKRNWLQVKNTRFGLLPTVSETRGLSGVTPGVSCAVSRTLPEFIVGLDMPLKELKTLLLKEEVQLLLMTAPGGCGKTTLVQMLCQDEQIQGTSIYFLFFCVIVCLRGRVCDFTFKKSIET